jgi:hypothetical protein
VLPSTGYTVSRNSAFCTREYLLLLCREIIWERAANRSAGPQVGYAAGVNSHLPRSYPWCSRQANSLYTLQFRFSIFSHKYLNGYSKASLCVTCLPAVIRSHCCCIKHSVSHAAACIEMTRECYTLERVSMYNIHVKSKKGYGLDGPGSVPGSCHVHSVQTDSGVHPSSCPMGTEGSFPGGKAAGSWSWPLTI